MCPPSPPPVPYFPVVASAFADALLALPMRVLANGCDFRHVVCNRLKEGLNACACDPQWVCGRRGAWPGGEVLAGDLGAWDYV